MGIDFLGFEYTAVASRPTMPLNEERARLQGEVLEHQEKWLSDVEADKELSQKK